MSRIDVNRLKAEADIVEIIGKSVQLKRKGSFFAGCCPFHNDTKASLEVVPSKNIWYCQPCDKGGDVISFFTESGYSFKEACEIVAGNSDVPKLDGVTTSTKAAPAKPEWTAIYPPPQTTPEFHHFRHGEPAYAWTYRAADGSILGYTVRFNTEDGGKEVLPFFYCTNGTKTEWRWKGPERPKPLYGLDRLAANPNATVILVEGEKTADALQAATPHVVVLSWMGGANGVPWADWTPIHGRKTLIWPDNDWEGMGAAIQIAHALDGKTPLLKIVTNPVDAPRGWDFADSGWDTETTRTYVNTHLVLPYSPEPSPVWAEPCDAHWILRNPNGEAARHLFLRNGRFVGQRIPDAEPPVLEAPVVETPQPESTVSIEYTDPQPELVYNEPGDFGGFDDDDAPPPDNDRVAPFEILGYEKIDLGKVAYVFFDKAKRVIIRKTTSELTKSALLELADLAYWEGKFPGSRSAKIDEDMARNWIIRTASARGLFNPKFVRGRGAWMDAKRVVIHAGDKLIVNGYGMPLGTLDTSYIYEISDPLNISPENPLDAQSAGKLLDLTRMLAWERDVNAVLLAGWCVVAPVCGALRWRPHIWVTGGAGSGKSWIMRNIVRELLGETALQVQGDTTEAGLRQTLGMDAMPVVFDEAEPHDPEANRRIQSVLSLMRSASTSDSGEIIKGTAGHAAKSFRISSCFAMASISVAVDKKSDRSRVTILSLTTKHKTNLETLDAFKMSVITPDFVERLQARTLSNLPTIIHNSAIFAQAAATVLGEQRIGDQLGPMLAGAYSLFSPHAVNYDKAIEWIKSHDWTEEKELDGAGDEHALLQHIYNQVHRVPLEAGFVERSITEIIDVAMGEFDEGLTSSRAFYHLRRHGILAESHVVTISNRHEYIVKLLRDTPWSKNHNKILLRIPGAFSPPNPVRFAGQSQSRAVCIPWSKGQ